MALVVRTNSNNPQTPLVVHHPLPSPVLNLSLMRNLFSRAERLVISTYNILSPNAILPLSDLSTLCKDPLYSRIIQSLNQLAYETLEEDEPKITVMLQETRGLIQAQLDINRATQAKIQFEQELTKKALLINKLKEQAFILYFNNGGRNTKQKIDEAMAIAAMGTLRFQDQVVLDSYWDAVAKNPWGAEWHQIIEKGGSGFFSNAMQEGYSVMSSLQNPQFKKLYGFFIRKTLEKSIKKVEKQWLTRRNEIKFQGDLIKVNYMILKGKLCKKPLLQHRLKQILEPLIFNTEDAVQNLVRQKKAQVQKEIAEHLEELNSPSCCIDPEIIRKESNCPESHLEYRLSANKEQREKCLKELAELQACTFESSLKWARLEWGYNPEELKGILADQTLFDQKVIEVLSLTSVTEDPNYLEDLQLDLTALPGPVAYFAERFKKHDEQALALFSP